jgi:hypothetical protein
MRDHHKNGEWLRDVDAKQQNIVFPDTEKNEARFWRNLGSAQWTTTTKVGLALLALFVFGTMAAIFASLVQEGTAWQVTWRLAVAVLFFWGPIFAALAWGTRRSLRDLGSKRRKR